MSEQLAIISDVHMGAEDHYGAALWFHVAISEGAGALQVIPYDQAKDIVSSVEDIKSLNGKPCWVEVDGGYIRFQRLWKK